MTSNQNIFDQLGPEWEEQAKQLLAAAQYDPDLGKQAAKDALRLVGGELSEAEFHQKHHEAYLKEFGVDKRPISSGGHGEGALWESVQNRHVSRRTLLKLAGLGLLIGYWSWLGSRARGAVAFATQDNYPSVLTRGDDKQVQRTGRMQYGMVVDLERCDGCLVCVIACQTHNITSPGVHWIYVFSYIDENQNGVNFLPRTCQHCSNPPCVKVCPVRARFKREDDGLVLIDYILCIGCRYCQVACPYGVNYFQWGEPGEEALFETKARGRWVSARPPRGVMGKCDFCPERQDREETRGTVVCALACPHGALYFGDMNDPDSPPNRYLKKKKEEKGYLSTFRLLQEYGTQPNIIYIGHSPSVKAKPVAGPVAYEDFGLVHERRTVLQGPRPWFKRIFRGD